MGNIDSYEEGSKKEPFFKLIKLLGIGGFAQTYKARVLNKDLIEDFGSEVVALKIPLPGKERALKSDLKMNTLLHLRLRNLQSVNIVRYLGFDIFDGKIVLAFEYIDHGSLRDKLGPIGKQTPLDIDESVKIAEGILKGLSVIHKERVFHRDIKPENILMHGESPKIADLGISRMLDSNEFASSSTGSPFYMSPEILSRKGASFTSDIWSLGVTMYEMLTGKLPFGDSNTALGDLIDFIRNDTPVAACEICPDIPKNLSNIIERALQKDPKKRYRSADNMLKALRRIQDNENDRIDKEMEPIRKSMSDLRNTGHIESKLQDILKRYPENPIAYRYLGEFYNLCQKYDRAITTFNMGLKYDANNAMLRWDLALAYQKTGKRNHAIQSLKKAISSGLDPNLERHAAILLKILRETTK